MQYSLSAFVVVFLFSFPQLVQTVSYFAGLGFISPFFPFFIWKPSYIFIPAIVCALCSVVIKIVKSRKQRFGIPILLIVVAVTALMRLPGRETIEKEFLRGFKENVSGEKLAVFESWAQKCLAQESIIVDSLVIFPDKMPREVNSLFRGKQPTAYGRVYEAARRLRVSWGGPFFRWGMEYSSIELGPGGPAELRLNTNVVLFILN